MKIVINIPEDEYKEILQDDYIPDGNFRRNMIKAIRTSTPLPKGHGRKFEEIMVEYPSAELCTYPEYKGKPYFSIKYEENGKHTIGYGTYKPEVLSEYLRKYFIKPTIIEANNKKSKIEMRDATPEEQKSVNDYVNSISKPTGINFYKEEQSE